MSLSVKRILLASFLVLTFGLAVNLQFYQTSKEANLLARRSVDDLLPMPKQKKLAAEDSFSKPKLASTSGVIVLNAGVNADTTHKVQLELRARGYDPGEADGVPSLATRAAIMAYEHDNSLPLTASPSNDFLNKLVQGVTGSQIAPPSMAYEPKVVSAQRQQIVRTVQQSLTAIGYSPGTIDGLMGVATTRAIRAFEIDQNMPETGRISGRLIRRLSDLAKQGRLASR